MYSVDCLLYEFNDMAWCNYLYEIILYCNVIIDYAFYCLSSFYVEYLNKVTLISQVSNPYRPAGVSYMRLESRDTL